MPNSSRLRRGALFASFWSLMSSLSALTVDISIHCAALRVSPASVHPLGILETLELSTYNPPNSINNELAVDSQAAEGFSHYSFYKQTSELFPEEPTFYLLEASVPLQEDADLNGIPDFLQVDLAVESIRAAGRLGDVKSSASAPLIWSRAKGERLGNMQIKASTETLSATLNHSFEVLDYRGTVELNRAGTNWQGTLRLKQLGAPENTMTGSLKLAVLATNRIAILPGTLTNQVGEVLQVLKNEKVSLSHQGYNGLLVFDDGDLSTSDREDYDFWFFRVGTVPDTDVDGIPDLTDLTDGPVDPEKRPKLSAALTETQVKISITDLAGPAVRLERSSELEGPWELVSMVVQDTTLTFSRSSTARKFFRLSR